jgi:hypothetical protein
LFASNTSFRTDIELSDFRSNKRHSPVTWQKLAGNAK